MIERFFLWRVHRRDAKSRYRLPRRRYTGLFAAGFEGTAKASRFWDSDDTLSRRRSRWRWVRRIVLLTVLGVLIWVIWQSIVGLQHF